MISSVSQPGSKEVTFLAKLLDLSLVALVCLISVSAAVLIYNSIKGQPIPTLSIKKAYARIGQKISIPAEEFRGSPVTVILVVSRTCSYCARSKQFHQRLIAESKRLSLPVILDLPETRGAESYIKTLANGAPVKLRSDKGFLGVPMTPTLLIVNSEGVITDMWTGLMTSDEEAMAFQRLGQGDQTTDFFKGSLSESQIGRMLEQPDVTLLDIRDRDSFGQNHRSRSVNIPFDELEVRARHELNQRALLVVDCESGVETPCDAADTILRERGFHKIAYLTNTPYAGLSCSAKTPGQLRSITPKQPHVE